MEKVGGRPAFIFFYHLNWFVVCFLSSHKLTVFFNERVKLKGGVVFSQLTSIGKPCIQASKNP